jgi:hypothetical protein
MQHELHCAAVGSQAITLVVWELHRTLPGSYHVGPTQGQEKLLGSHRYAHSLIGKTATLFGV